MITFFIIVISIYLLINFYILKRFFQAFEYKNKNRKIIFLLFYFPFTFSYSIAKGLLVQSNSVFYDILLWIGSFWFAFIVYFLLFTLLIDGIRFVIKKLKIKPEFIFSNYSLFKKKLMIVVIALTVIIIGYGYYNSQQIIIKNISLVLHKKNSEIEKIKIVFFADSHLTPVNNGKFLDKVTRAINNQNPDLILLAGDIIDDKTNNLVRYNINQKLRQLKSKFGIFTCNGNHEFIIGVDEADKFLSENKITVLRDSFITISNSIQIIGREDKSSSRFNKERLSLMKIIEKTNKNLPSVLLDHQPINLNEAVENNIDLQLSGHTHNGQFFPGNLIVKLFYELPVGYLKKEKTNFYVTSGVGTWGPPIKIFSDAEIIIFNITFQ